MVIMNLSIFRRRWITTALLSVVLPMSLLATFRLTGVLREPQPPQTVAVEAVVWNMSRPPDGWRSSSSIDEKVENLYEDELASIVFGIHLSGYTDNSGLLGDYLFFLLYVASNISEGFISSMAIKFSKVDIYAFLDIKTDPDWIKLQNLEIRTVRDSFETQYPYIDTYIIYQPKYTSLEIYAYWMFLDENSLSHWITATLEVTYFNGTAYQTIIMPIRLEVLVD